MPKHFGGASVSGSAALASASEVAMDLVCSRDGLPRDGLLEYSDLDSRREEFFVDLDSGCQDIGILPLDEWSKARGAVLSVAVGGVLRRLGCRELLTSCSSASRTALPSWDDIRRISRRACKDCFLCLSSCKWP